MSPPDFGRSSFMFGLFGLVQELHQAHVRHMGMKQLLNPLCRPTGQNQDNKSY